MPLLARALSLAAAGALLGLGGNLLSPRPARLLSPVRPAAEVAAICRLPGSAPLAPRISVEQATPMCVACTAAFVDARGADEYAAGHVSGAIHLPPGQISLADLLRLERYGTVVVYDGEASSGQADEVAGALRERGLTNVRVLEGAWPAWLAAGAPGESGACAACPPRPATSP